MLVRAFGPDAPRAGPGSGSEALSSRGASTSRAGSEGVTGSSPSPPRPEPGGVGVRAGARGGTPQGGGPRDPGRDHRGSGGERGHADRAPQFAALRALGRVADGWRGPATSTCWSRPATRAGWPRPGPARPARRGLPGRAHQLPQLRDAAGRAVEVPPRPVCASPGAPPATAEALAAADLLQRADLPGECWVPRPRVLVAHAVVHALGQHGFVPGAYPALRLVTDLLALAPTRPAAASAARRCRSCPTRWPPTR
jgi:hypothetical protein